MYFSWILFCGIALTKTLILTPKNDDSLVNLKYFTEEHNVLPLATFGDDLTIYKMDQEDYLLYPNTLNDLFYVEEEQIYSIRNENDFVLVNEVDDSRPLNTPWHLDRVSKVDLPLDGEFPHSSSGSCHTNEDVDIHTYVIDTGIDVDHPEFEGRATWLANFADSKDTDCNSHGTHCAGLVGSRSYGVCKDAKLFAVKVLDCRGSGTTTGVISGIEFAYKRHLQQSSKDQNVKSIVSMSLGGGFSRALNMAVQATLKDPGFYFAAAAGNEDQDACKTSPASVKDIFTVMASDKFDNRAYFSNYGKCADMYSPGVDILSTIPNGRTAVYSGTSMATPVLVGVLNHYVDQFPELNMKQMKSKMMEDASKDKLSSNPKQTNNLLVYLHR